MHDSMDITFLGQFVPLTSSWREEKRNWRSCQYTTQIANCDYSRATEPDPAFAGQEKTLISGAPVQELHRLKCEVIALCLGRGPFVCRLFLFAFGARISAILLL